MSPYQLNVAAGAHALSPALRSAKKYYFFNVKELPKRRLAVTNRGKAIAKHPTA
jgi:hypothetical protein